MPASHAPTQRRFYKAVSVAETDEGFGLRLDGRPVKTPAGRLLAVPARPLADAIAEEWSAQKDIISIEELRLTRLANSAIDGLVGREAEAREDIMRFAASDLVCYRASSPAELRANQAEAWDPILDWARQSLNAPLLCSEGVRFVEQPANALANLRAALDAYSTFQLAALHVMASLLGSALLALAHARGRLTLQEAWDASLIDEDWQIKRWGEDFEASERRKRRFLEMEAASRLFQLASSHPAH